MVLGSWACWKRCSLANHEIFAVVDQKLEWEVGEDFLDPNDGEDTRPEPYGNGEGAGHGSGAAGSAAGSLVD